MAFTYETTKIPGGAGSKAYAYGTFDSTGGDTGGTIQTGLQNVVTVQLTPAGAAAAASAPTINPSTSNLSTGAIVVITDANQSGVWYAIGD